MRDASHHFFSRKAEIRECLCKWAVSHDSTLAASRILRPTQPGPSTSHSLGIRTSDYIFHPLGSVFALEDILLGVVAFSLFGEKSKAHLRGSTERHNPVVPRHRRSRHFEQAEGGFADRDFRHRVFPRDSISFYTRFQGLACIDPTQAEPAINYAALPFEGAAQTGGTPTVELL